MRKVVKRRRKQRNALSEYNIPKRPKYLASTTYCVNTGIGRAYITITEYKSKPFEIFISLGKTGTILNNLANSIARLASVMLRAGLPPALIIKQLIDITDIQVWDDGKQIKSLPDAVAKTLKKHIKELKCLNS